MSQSNDVDPGLAQERDWSETVTNNRDINGNGRNTRAKNIWDLIDWHVLTNSSLFLVSILDSLAMDTIDVIGEN